MLGISLILVAFCMTIIAMLAEHRTNPEESRAFGMSRRGVLLVSLAVLSLVLGVWQEIASSNRDREDKEALFHRLDEQDTLAKQQYQEIVTWQKEQQLRTESVVGTLEQIPLGESQVGQFELVDSALDELRTMSVSLDSLPVAAGFSLGVYYDSEGYFTIHSDGRPMRGTRIRP